ncbi:acyltransferase family protein [Verrucomicrobium sp. BvORR106]|uniref:acyltransferase family protein n=1 Tax=Verrucomicrobium sp. BvORR106 TaxID=1403819 RepID=UPI002240FBF9|nr:acyltransferase family protein [Verrucomicrobium sp. BvORR106]
MQWLFLLAMALVFNSHLEEFHLRPWLAGDGLLGNAMFFVLSGYRVSLSLSRRATGIVPYLQRRLLRIYPTVWLVTLTLGLTAGWLTFNSTIHDVVRLLFWPTRFTYITWIVPAYILLFFIERCRPNLATRSAFCLGLFSAFLALSWTEPTPRMLSDVSGSIYFLLFLSLVLAGTLLANTSIWRKPGWLLPCTALAMIVLYFAVKLQAALTGNWSWFAVILGLGGIGGLLVVAAGLPGRIFAPLKHVPGLSACAAFVAQHSLEIYTIHSVVIEWKWLPRSYFPSGIAIAVVVTALLALIYGHTLKRLLPAARLP